MICTQSPLKQGSDLLMPPKLTSSKPEKKETTAKTIKPSNSIKSVKGKLTTNADKDGPSRKSGTGSKSKKINIEDSSKKLEDNTQPRSKLKSKSKREPIDRKEGFKPDEHGGESPVPLGLKDFTPTRMKKDTLDPDLIEEARRVIEKISLLFTGTETLLNSKFESRRSFSLSRLSSLAESEQKPHAEPRVEGSENQREPETMVMRTDAANLPTKNPSTEKGASSKHKNRECTVKGKPEAKTKDFEGRKQRSRFFSEFVKSISLAAQHQVIEDNLSSDASLENTGSPDENESDRKRSEAPEMGPLIRSFKPSSITTTLQENKANEARLKRNSGKNGYYEEKEEKLVIGSLEDAPRKKSWTTLVCDNSENVKDKNQSQLETLLRKCKGPETVLDLLLETPDMKSQPPPRTERIQGWPAVDNLVQVFDLHPQVEKVSRPSLGEQAAPPRSAETLKIASAQGVIEVASAKERNHQKIIYELTQAKNPEKGRDRVKTSSVEFSKSKNLLLLLTIKHQEVQTEEAERKEEMSTSSRVDLRLPIVEYLFFKQEKRFLSSCFQGWKDKGKRVEQGSFTKLIDEHRLYFLKKRLFACWKAVKDQSQEKTEKIKIAAAKRISDKLKESNQKVSEKASNYDLLKKEEGKKQILEKQKFLDKEFERMNDFCLKSAFLIWKAQFFIFSNQEMVVGVAQRIREEEKKVAHQIISKDRCLQQFFLRDAKISLMKSLHYWKEYVQQNRRDLAKETTKLLQASLTALRQENALLKEQLAQAHQGKQQNADSDKKQLVLKERAQTDGSVLMYKEGNNQDVTPQRKGLEHENEIREQTFEIFEDPSDRKFLNSMFSVHNHREPPSMFLAVLMLFVTALFCFLSCPSKACNSQKTQSFIIEVLDVKNFVSEFFDSLPGQSSSPRDSLNSALQKAALHLRKAEENLKLSYLQQQLETQKANVSWLAAMEDMQAFMLAQDIYLEKLLSSLKNSFNPVFLYLTDFKRDLCSCMPNHSDSIFGLMREAKAAWKRFRKFSFFSEVLDLNETAEREDEKRWQRTQAWKVRMKRAFLSRLKVPRTLSPPGSRRRVPMPGLLDDLDCLTVANLLKGPGDMVDRFVSILMGDNCLPLTAIAYAKCLSAFSKQASLVENSEPNSLVEEQKANRTSITWESSGKASSEPILEQERLPDELVAIMLGLTFSKTCDSHVQEFFGFDVLDLFRFFVFVKKSEDYDFESFLDPFSPFPSFEERFLDEDEVALLEETESFMAAQDRRQSVQGPLPDTTSFHQRVHLVREDTSNLESAPGSLVFSNSQNLVYDFEINKLLRQMHGTLGSPRKRYFLETYSEFGFGFFEVSVQRNGSHLHFPVPVTKRRMKVHKLPPFQISGGHQRHRDFLFSWTVRPPITSPVPGSTSSLLAQEKGAWELLALNFGISNFKNMGHGLAWMPQIIWNLLFSKKTKNYLEKVFESFVLILLKKCSQLMPSKSCQISDSPYPTEGLSGFNRLFKVLCKFRNFSFCTARMSFYDKIVDFCRHGRAHLGPLRLSNVDYLWVLQPTVVVSFIPIPSDFMDAHVKAEKFQEKSSVDKQELFEFTPFQILLNLIPHGKLLFQHEVQQITFENFIWLGGSKMTFRKYEDIKEYLTTESSFRSKFYRCFFESLAWSVAPERSPRSDVVALVTQRSHAFSRKILNIDTIIMLLKEKRIATKVVSDSYIFAKPSRKPDKIKCCSRCFGSKRERSCRRGICQEGEPESASSSAVPSRGPAYQLLSVLLHANLLIGVHGSNLWLSPFLKRPGVVIEIMPRMHTERDVWRFGCGVWNFERRGGAAENPEGGVEFISLSSENTPYGRPSAESRIFHICIGGGWGGGVQPGGMDWRRQDAQVDPAEFADILDEALGILTSE